MKQICLYFIVVNSIILAIQNESINHEILKIEKDSIQIKSDKKLNNNGTIFSQNSLKDAIDEGNFYLANDTGNVIQAESNSEIINFGIINSSLNDISVKDLEVINSGNGLIGNSKVINNGTIKGSIVAISGDEKDLELNSKFYLKSGNGMIVTGDIINDGILSGESLSKSGFSKKSSTSYVSESGNGIIGNANVKNDGVIKGQSFSEGGITNSSDAYQTTSTSDSDGSGNGIMGGVAIENSGLITGNSRQFGGVSESIASTPFSFVGNRESGNGLVGNSNLINKGLIKGNAFLQGGKSISTTGFLSSIAYAEAKMSGNGVAITNSDTINNSGQIVGNLSIEGGTYDDTKKDYEKIEFSGNGISIADNLNSNIINSGVIGGSGSAIAATSITGKILNEGILFGRMIFGDGKEIISNDSNYIIDKNLTELIPSDELNKGIYVILNEDKKTIKKVINGIAGTSSENGKEIINADITSKNDDSFIKINDKVEFINNIINGVGVEVGVLDINNTSVKLDNSIINSYKTTVSLNNGTLEANDTIFNGGGLDEVAATIEGKIGNNNIKILGNSIINGNVIFGDGNDLLTITNSVQINGDLKGGLGNDTLNLGEKTVDKTSSNLNIFHDISGFETINTKGNVTLFETARINDGNLNIESGNLTLRVNPLDKDENGHIKGHALFGNNGTLTSNGGNLVIGLNGLGEGAIISMGGTTIAPETNDSWWKDTDHIKTNSLVLDGKLSADGKDINITVLESIPLEPSIPVPPIEPEPPIAPPTVVDSLLYEKLNKVYQSIVSAGEIGTLANTTLIENVVGDSYLETVQGEGGKTFEESLGGLLTILDQMYANNPYAYTLKSSRDSLKLFEDNMSYLTIKPKKDETIVQGKAIYTGVKNDSSASGKNYHGFDTGHRNYKTTTNTVGGLATFEYGLSDDTSLGFVFGGNNQDVNFKGSSKIKGNSLYLGTFAKTDINNFKFMSGVGYQYTSADVDRKVSNKYDSFSTGDKYDINSLNAFVEAKYVY
ncbi:MAG: beta strand repeat-containing protein, partial [Cetobacterium sp.]